MKVRKCNGNEEDFHLSKIFNAVKLANNSVEKEKRMTDEKINQVVDFVQKKIKNYSTIDVNTIHDFVEKALMNKNQYDVAKAYVLYRNNKKKDKKYDEDEVFAFQDYLLDHIYEYGDYELDRDYVFVESKKSARKNLKEEKATDSLFEDVVFSMIKKFKLKKEYDVERPSWSVFNFRNKNKDAQFAITFDEHDYGDFLYGDVLAFGDEKDDIFKYKTDEVKVDSYDIEKECSNIIADCLAFIDTNKKITIFESKKSAKKSLKESTDESFSLYDLNKHDPFIKEWVKNINKELKDVSIESIGDDEIIFRVWFDETIDLDIFDDIATDCMPSLLIEFMSDMNIDFGYQFVYADDKFTENDYVFIRFVAW